MSAANSTHPGYGIAGYYRQPRGEIIRGMLASAAILSLLILGPPANAQENPAAIPRAAPAGTKRYIVSLKKQADQDACIRQHAITRLRTFRHAINGFVADLTPAAAARLRRDERVSRVSEDAPIAKFQTQTIPNGLRRIEVLTHPLAKIDGLDERIDVDVAVIDSGIQPNHPDLNVHQSVYLVAGGRATLTNPHGTQCAGIIGALDNGYGVVGVAPGCRLWSVRISDSQTIITSDIIAGFNYVSAHAAEIEVVNCSFATNYGTGKFRAEFEEPIAQLVSQGVLVIAGTGNDGMDIAGPDGVLGGVYVDDTLPAALPQVMAVSGMDPLSDQFIAISNFSRTAHVPGNVASPGAAIDLAAPAVSVATTGLDSGYYPNFHGTSAAGPHVAGLAALYIARHGRATDAAGVYRIRQALIDAALPQSRWPATNTLDPDLHHEGLALASLSWAANAPQITNLVKTPGGANLDFTTTPGYRHVLQFSDSLGISQPWASLSELDGTGASVSVNNPNTRNERFYRLASRALSIFPSSHPTAINSGTLGVSGNGIHLADSLGVAGAIAGDVANKAVRMSADLPASRVQIPYLAALNPSGAFSVEFWARPAQTANFTCPASAHEFVPPLFLQRNGWIFYQTNLSFRNGNGFHFRCYHGPSDASATTAAVDLTLANNTWYHLVGVFDGGQVILYVNGANVASAALPGGSAYRPNTQAPLTLGVRSDTDLNFPYTGDLDEAAFYPRALSAAEVLEHYQTGDSSAPPVSYQQTILNDSPLLYWRLDEAP